MASKLINRSAQSLAQPGVAGAGALFETFIVNELLKQAPLAQTQTQMFHDRDCDGAEP